MDVEKKIKEIVVSRLKDPEKIAKSFNVQLP